MTDTTTEEVKTEKVFDLATGKYIEKPIEGEQGRNERRPIYGEGDGSGGGEDDGNKPADDGNKPKPAEPTNQEPPAPAFEPGSYIKEKFGEKFGIESESDLQELLESQEKLVQIAEASKQRVAELEKAEPQYRTEQEKKIAEFLKPFDPSKFGEGLNTVASIMAMDPMSVSGKVAMEEAYVIAHPELTREEAKELFSSDEWSKYQVDKNNFDTDEDFLKAKRLSDIRLKSAEDQARKVLLQKKEELKAAPPKPDAQPARVEKPAEAPKESVSIYQKELDKYFIPDKDKVFDRINYYSDDQKTLLASVVLDKQRLDDVKGFVSQYIKNPTIYDKDGKIPNFDPQELTRTAIRILHGDWYEEQLFNQIKVMAGRLTAEQIAGTTPDKRSAAGGDAKLSVDDQFAELAKKEKEKRTR